MMSVTWKSHLLFVGSIQVSSYSISGVETAKRQRRSSHPYTLALLMFVRESWRHKICIVDTLLFTGFRGRTGAHASLGGTF